MNSIISLITKHPASSLRSGIGQVIKKLESTTSTNLGGLTNVKLMFNVSIKWPLIYPKAFKHFCVPPPKGTRTYLLLPNIIIAIFLHFYFTYYL